MNRLSLARRAAIIRSLVEGASMRSIARAQGCDKDVVCRLLVEVGEFCSIYQHVVLRDLPCERVEVDEIWAFVGAKNANKKNDKQGDIWTFTAICATSKLAVSWLVGSRTSASTHAFIRDLAPRLRNRVQITTDAWAHYRQAIERGFGWQMTDYATITKVFEGFNPRSGRYSPSPRVVGVEKVAVMGNPNPRFVSTSYVERSNLTMRMAMRRFTRLTNGFSKKAENHAHAVSLHFMHYNFCRPHMTLGLLPFEESVRELG